MSYTYKSRLRRLRPCSHGGRGGGGERADMYILTCIHAHDMYTFMYIYMDDLRRLGGCSQGAVLNEYDICIYTEYAHDMYIVVCVCVCVCVFVCVCVCV